MPNRFIRPGQRSKKCKPKNPDAALARPFALVSSRIAPKCRSAPGQRLLLWGLQKACQHSQPVLVCRFVRAAALGRRSRPKWQTSRQ